MIEAHLADEQPCLIWVMVDYREAWRYKGQFSPFNRIFKGMFPGFGIAVVAFTGYCAAEALFFKGDDKHGKEHH